MTSARLLERVEDFHCANELEPFDLGALVRRRRRRRERKRGKAKARARKLPVIGGRRARRRLVLGARLIAPMERFRGASEPVMGARLRRRMRAHLLDAGEVRRRRRRVIEEPQRDPAGHEVALDPGVFLGRLGRFRHHPIGRAGIADIEQLARHYPSLDPPFLAVVDLGEIGGSGQHHLRGFGDLLVVAQEVRAGEEITGIAARLLRHGVEQLLGIAAALAGERETQLGDREVGAPQPVRRAHRGVLVGGDKPLLHARLVIGPAQEVGVALEHLLLDIGGNRIVAPRIAHQRLGAFGVALRRSARAPAPAGPCADCGGEPSKKLMTRAGLAFSTQSIASARRRNAPRLGQLGLAAMKAV